MTTTREQIELDKCMVLFVSNVDKYSKADTVEPLYNGHLGDRRKWPL